MEKGTSLNVSYFNNEKDNVPVADILPLDELEVREQKHKGGKLWSPVAYKKGATRGKAGVESVHAFVVDIDDGTPPSVLAEFWEDFEYHLYSTHSHKPEHPKWRAIFPFSQAVDGKDWDRTWRKLTAFLGVDGIADPSCCDSSRIYYMPTSPPGGESFIEHHAGKLLDPSMVPDIPVDVSPPAKETSNAGKPGDDFNKRATWADLLTADGWTVHRHSGARCQWRRPGKSSGSHSAMDGGGKTDLLYVWSSNANVPCGPYTKFGYLTVTRYGGDYSAAARDLAKQGYGAPREKVQAEAMPGEEIDVSSYPLTDGANSDLFVRVFGADYVHVRERGTGPSIDNGWFHYCGGLWRQDPNSAFQDGRIIAAMRRRDAIADEKAKRGGENIPDDVIKAKRSWAKSSDGARGIGNMLRLAATDKLIEAKQSAFDSNRLILCTPSGVADLLTGKLREAERADMLTLCTSVPFDPSADTREWEKFVLEIMDGNEELANYLQRLFGYTLTGLTTSRAWVMLYGEAGRNGKNTFLDTVQYAMGSYAGQSSVETWLISPGRKKETDMATLYGRRLTVASETDPKRRLDENLIKSITGDENCVGEFKYGMPFTYQATVKLWLATNHRPHVAVGDPAFWDRLKLIPFMRQFPVDPTFKERIKGLAKEALAWGVRGAVELFADGGRLQDPDSVRVAIDDYKASSDDLREWKEDCCVIGPDEVETTAELYKSYCEYCEREGSKPMSQTFFGKKLTEQKFKKGFADRTKRQRTWAGIRVKTIFDEEDV